MISKFTAILYVDMVRYNIVCIALDDSVHIVQNHRNELEWKPYPF